MLRLHQHGTMLCRKGKAALGRPCGGIVDLENATHRLILQPFTHVALIRTSARGQLDRRRRTILMQRSIESKFVAQIDTSNLLESDHRLEHLVGE